MPTRLNAVPDSDHTPFIRQPVDKSIRVMLVDDSLTVRTVFTRIIEAEADFLLTGQASTAEAALAQLAAARPDVVLLDLEMPGMGGLKALPHLLAQAHGIRVLVVSSLTEAGAWHSLEAMREGAADTMPKPRPGDFDQFYQKQLVAKIRALGVPSAAGTQSRNIEGVPPVLRRCGKQPRLVAIGASTGGVHAIGAVLEGLPPSFTLPILVTQHIPASFVPVFARQLELISGRETIVAAEGTAVRPSQIILAPGHAHMSVHAEGRRLVTGLGQQAVPTGCMPAADPMLSSIAAACEGAAVALILSGMGRDGLTGATDLIEAGGTVIAQSAESCAVWGMPKAVTVAGLVAGVMPPARMPAWLLQFTGGGAWK